MLASDPVSAAERPPRAGSFPGETAVAVLLPLLAGLWSLRLGADFNYDLRHYHFYNGWALVTGRLDHDLAPAGLQSFFNPLQDGLYYLGIRHLPPRLFGFLLGALHGTALVLVHRIARHALAGDPGGRWLALLATVLAALGSNALSLVGTTTGDLLVILPALLALLLVVGAEAPWRPAAAGFAAGIAAGLKLTMLFPAAALAAALALPGAGRRPAALVRFAGVGLLGYLAVAGFWSARLLERFANPVFPFLNGLFRSPFFRTEGVFEPRFTAREWWEGLGLPLQMAMGWTSGLQEIRFREARFLFVLLALVVWLVSRRRSPASRILGRSSRFLLVFWLVGYVLWAYGLHYFRYAAILELLAPLVILVLLRASPVGRPAVVLAVALVIALGSRPVSWGRVAWSDDWFGVRLPATPGLERGLVIVAGERVSYVAPFFPPSTVFVGLTWRGSPGLDGLVAGRLLSHPGPFFLLQGVRAHPADASRFGLSPAGDCRRIETRDGGLCLWPLARLPSR